MIDSLALVWGAAPSSEARRARARRHKGKDRLERVTPIELDWNDLEARLGAGDGEIREIQYASGSKRFGHWQLDGVDVMYRDGRLELRASLPKLLLGRNDVVLTEDGVHAALDALLGVGRRAADRPLDLADARPRRLDYAYQWDVPSVALVLDHIKATFGGRRKLRTEHVSTKGGRSLVYGYGGKRPLRFYDKVGELVDQGTADPIVELDPAGLVLGELRERELDTLLRYEVQDRRAAVLQLIHERGYRAADVQRELERPVESLSAAYFLDLQGLLTGTQGSRAVLRTLGLLHLAQHDELAPQVRRAVPRSTYYRWRRDGREAAKALETWRPTIPPDVFAGGAHGEERAAA